MGVADHCEVGVGGGMRGGGGAGAAGGGGGGGVNSRNPINIDPP